MTTYSARMAVASVAVAGALLTACQKTEVPAHTDSTATSTTTARDKLVAPRAASSTTDSSGPIVFTYADSTGTRSDTLSLAADSTDADTTSATAVVGLDRLIVAGTSAAASNRPTQKMVTNAVNAVNAGTASRVFTIIQMSGLPQFKTEWRTKTVARVLRKKIKTRVPVTYRRTATEGIQAVVTYPESFEADAVPFVEQCGKLAAAAAVAGALAQQVQGALVAFNVTFQGCIVAKVGERSSQIRTDVKAFSTSGDWHPI